MGIAWMDRTIPSTLSFLLLRHVQFGLLFLRITSVIHFYRAWKALTGACGMTVETFAEF